MNNQRTTSPFDDMPTQPYPLSPFTELDSPEVAQLFEKQPGRVERVARGSGTKVEEVKELLCQFTMFVQWKQQKGIPANQNPHQPMQLRECNWKFAEAFDFTFL